jgi:hypothetical protein
MKQWIVALTAAYKGIKRANPLSKVLSIDPSGMSPSRGIPMLDAYLGAGGGAITDIVAIHPYRTRPEDPDLDADIASLLAMLARHNYTGEIWFTEGGGHLGIHNPAGFALNVHETLSDENNGGSWRLGSLAYDIGDGERFAAAYAVRAWLVGLKFGDRVKQQVDWRFGSGAIDYNNTAEVRAIALSAQTAMLGDADFVWAVPLNADTRCYLFNDAENRPVVAVWATNLKPRTQTALRLGALAAKLQIVNMVGTSIAVGKSNTIAVSPFPIYLRGEAGSTSKLAEAIKGSVKLLPMKAVAHQ